MGTTSQEQLNFHWDVIPKTTKKALDFLAGQEWIGRFGWYLAGGTALALQTGHRTSVDLDFFTNEAKFEATEVTGNFSGNDNWEITSDRPSTIYGSLFQAKISFIAYPFFMPKQPFVKYGSINILQPLDIAVMKVIAVSQRGRKRDFFDLYWCAKNLESLENIIGRLKEQYPSVAHDFHHILKSLVYFNDAESDPTLMLHFDVSWEQVKKFFTEEIEKIAFMFV